MSGQDWTLRVGQGIEADPVLFARVTHVWETGKRRYEQAGEPSGVERVQRELRLEAFRYLDDVSQLLVALFADAPLDRHEIVKIRWETLGLGRRTRMSLARARSRGNGSGAERPWVGIEPLVLGDVLRLSLGQAVGTARLIRAWRRRDRLRQVVRAIPPAVVGIGIFALGGVAVDKQLNYDWLGAAILAVGLWLTENVVVDLRLERWLEGCAFATCRRERSSC
jgi:hypothetical protein